MQIKKWFNILLFSVFLVSGSVLGETTLPISDSSVMEWADKVAAATYRLDKTTLNEKISLLSQYFTENGWKDFKAGIERTGGLGELINRNVSISAVLGGKPSITNRGQVGEQTFWEVNVPLIVTYSAAGNDVTQNLIVKMKIVTVPKGEGLAIDKFIVSTVVSFG